MEGNLKHNLRIHQALNNLKKLTSVLPLGLLVLGCSSPRNPAETHQMISVEHQFAEEVLLGAEYGTKTNSVRWVSAPTVSAFYANDEERLILSETLSQINEALTGTNVQMVEGAPNDRQSSIRVYFAPLAELDSIAQSEGFRYITGNLGLVWNFWNPSHEIVRSVVLIAKDKLKGQMLKHIVLEELTQSLGLMDDSALFQDSVFYSSEGDGGGATRLSIQDRKLIRFFYSHLRPGDGPNELFDAFSGYWNDTVVE